jgi:hypothetical protein
MGATNVIDRLRTSIGCEDGVEPKFNDCADVPNGGVLLALPALLAQGLLNRLNDHFQLPKGYYTLQSIFILMAFLALARLKFIETLKYVSPGEWGKILGVDRIPEARTLRGKIAYLSEKGQPKQWSAELCKNWMAAAPSEAGVLYVDGHVRVYHGNQTKLPRHYVAREKLCARATCDYWVNAMNGNPFFYINKAVDPGLLQVLEHEIIPRLEQDIPNQPTPEELEANPLLPRFTIVSDREAYSPKFMAKMWVDKRIAVQTYSRNPRENWPEEEFELYSSKLLSGKVKGLRLAERGTLLGGIWVREVRRLRDNNIHGSMISTNYSLDLVSAFTTLISRWSQENFFGYCRREYNLDRLVDYGLEDVSDTVRITNPKYRELNSKIRKLTSELQRKKLEFSGITLDGDIAPENVEKYERRKAELLENMTGLAATIDEQKKERKKHPKHVLFNELTEEHKFQQLRTHAKHLTDTIKMVAYRAETSMASIVREKIPTHSDGTTRSLLRGIYNSAADLKVDDEKKVLTVCLHRQANQSSDIAAQYLCDELNATETTFPGTGYRLVYKLVS